MKYRIKSIILAVFCSVSSLTSAVAGESSRTANPALLYWQAAAELPSLSDSQAKQLRDIASGKADFKPEATRELKLEPAVKFLRKAAASEAPCDWGLAWEDGVHMSMRHMAKLREFSTIVLVLAEEKFANDEIEAGVDLLQISHHIARDTGATPTLIGNAFQNVLERRTIATAARHCLEWEVSERERYAKQLSELSELIPIHRAFASELFWVGEWERQLEGDLEEASKQLALPAGSKIADSFKSPEGIKEMIDAYREAHAKGMAMLKLEGKPRHDAIVEFEKTIMAEGKLPKNFLVSLAMPSVGKMVRGEDQTALAQAMFKAALKYGPKMTEKDVAAQPFDLVRTDGGFELKSKELEFSLKFAK